MNLVQINERLKDLPMQVIQQYANGMNPEVPPYLALGELQRRELSQKQMATAQGAQQGPQPSVKEQVEQKAGLMALQQMQQQQMAQQQAQPRGPMPVPAGVPQPEQQPQAPQPQAMMARGGLAGIPVRRDMFEYAGGGIIAFQSGGQSLNERAARQMKEKGSIYDPFFGLPAEERERMKEQAALKAAQDRARESMAVTESNAQALSGGAQARVAELEANRDALIRQYGAKQYEQALSKAKSEVNAASARGSELMAQQSQMGQSRVAEATPPPKPPAPAPVEQASLRAMDNKMMPAGLPGAAQQMGAKAAPTSLPAAPRPSMAAAPMPTAAPVAPQAGLLGAAAAMTPQDEVAKMAMEAVRTPAKAMTPEEAMAQEGKFASQYGLDKKFGEEERGLLALMKQRQADFAKRRPMEELGATLRGFGQGYGGASAAGERAGRETYEMDMANQREALNAINALNKENLATGKERYKSGSGLFGESQKSAAAANQQRTQTLGQMRGQDITAAESAANRLNNLEVEKLRNAERRAERTQPGSAPMVRAEYLRMMDQVFALEDKGEKDKADALRRRADARLTAGGGASAAGVGAGPKPMTRDQALKTVGDILENPMMSRGFIADAKAGLTAQGIANPTMIQIQEYLVQQHMKGADLAAPTQTGLPSGVTVKRVGP
jgi:hypothetical protein